MKNTESHPKPVFFNRGRWSLHFRCGFGVALALAIGFSLPSEDPTIAGLIQALGDDNPQVKLKALNRAVEILSLNQGSSRGGEFSPEAVDHFLQLFGRDSDSLVLSLGQCLASEDLEVRVRSSSLLKTFRGRAKSAKPFLVPALDDPNADVRENAVVAMSRLGLPIDEIAPVLIRKMRDLTLNIQIVSEVMLAEQFELATPATDRVSGKIYRANTGNAIVLPTLVTALGDPHVQVRRGAAHCLFRLGDTAKPAYQNINSGLEDADMTVRLFCAKAIVLLNRENKKALEILLSSFQLIVADLVPRNFPSASREAREVILRIGPPAIPLLINRLTDNVGTSEGTSLEVIHLLGWFKKDSVNASAVLMNLLKSSNPNIRREAAWALGRIGGASRSVAASLILALDDREVSVRLSAVQALEALGFNDKETISALEHALKDDNSDVRSAAEMVLKNLK